MTRYPLSPFGMNAALRLGAGLVALAVLWAAIGWAVSA